MIQKVAEYIWKIPADSNVYYLDFGDKIIIDTGARGNRHIIEQFLGKLIKLSDVNKVIFTHLHYDHIGNFDLFPNARFFASVEAIECLEKDPMGTVLNADMVEKFKSVQLNALKSMYGLKVLRTPGHTKGSISLWYEKEKILFSGDTLFYEGYGRTDLPTSVPDELENSIKKLKKLKPKILCPGHEY